MWDKSSFCIPKSADDVIVVVYLFVSVDSFIVIYGVWLVSFRRLLQNAWVECQSWSFAIVRYGSNL